MAEQNKDAVLSPINSCDAVNEPWYSPFLQNLRDNLENASAVQILSVFLAPFIIQYNAHFSQSLSGTNLQDADIDPDQLFRQMRRQFSAYGAGTCSFRLKDRIKKVENWLDQHYHIYLMDHYSSVRLEPYKNIVSVAQQMYFPNSLTDAAQAQDLCGFFAAVLKWIFASDARKLQQLNSDLRQTIQIKRSDIIPEDHLDPAVATAIALYSAILVCVFPKVKFQSPPEGKNALKLRLPLQEPMVYPRQGSASEHSTEVTRYIRVVESFPAGTIERHQAMQNLWRLQNYYAGWELYQQYCTGAILTNAAGTQHWRLDPSPSKAVQILNQLAANDPSQAVAYCQNPQQPLEPFYHPQLLAFIRKTLCDGACPSQKLEKEIIPTLDYLQKISGDGKMLYYLACKEKGDVVNPDYLLGQREWGSAELWDILADSERITRNDLFTGARCGSAKCLQLCLEQSLEPDALNDLFYDVLQMPDWMDPEQKAALYQVIQRYYDDKRRYNAVPRDALRLQRDNILLIGCGLRRLRRKVRKETISLALQQTLEDLERCQTELEAWVNQPEEPPSDIAESYYQKALADMQRGDFVRLIDEPALIC